SITTKHTLKKITPLTLTLSAQPSARLTLPYRCRSRCPHNHICPRPFILCAPITIVLCTKHTLNTRTHRTAALTLHSAFACTALCEFFLNTQILYHIPALFYGTIN
ncbi:MAG: hypothetical protein RSC25_03490, partial [Christensenella sp.]